VDILECIQHTDIRGHDIGAEGLEQDFIILAIVLVIEEEQFLQGLGGFLGRRINDS
jgi:hypothetical protein